MASADRFAVGYTGPTDISGWLAVLILWFVLQVIPYSIASFGFIHFHRFGGAFFESLVFAGFAAVTGYLLFIKNKKGVLLAKLYLIVRLCVLVVEITSLGKAAVLRNGLAVCMLILWYLYLVRSKRVKSIYSPAS